MNQNERDIQRKLRILKHAEDIGSAAKTCSSHYLIEPTACTPASGWEKGQVENQVCFTG